MKIYDKLFIGGQWVESSSGKFMDIINPANEEIWAKVTEGMEADVDEAVKSARFAFDHGIWRKMSTYERTEILRKMGQLVQENAEHLARMETLENGKPYHLALREAQNNPQWWFYYAGIADKIHGETIPFEDNKHIFTLREPLGVVGAITAWNTPLLMATQKLSMALAAGNTVVLKPARTTPITALELAKLAEKAGFPPGVVNVVTGRGETAGNRLVSHMDVDKLTFTGATETARKLMSTASVNMKKLSFELGGKSPQVIFPDANLDAAFESAVTNAFVLTGQSCTLGSRVLVHRDIYKDFVSKYIEKVKELTVGDPFTNVDLGPHAHEQQLNTTLDYINIGLEEGAILAAGGERPSDLANGYYIQPTVFVDVDPSMRIAKEEIFGPVVSLIPFSDEEEAIEIANSVSYGLTSGVWTKDTSRAFRMAKNIKAGTVWLNTFRYVRWVTPYGGYKASGWGRENGIEAINEYTHVKTVVVDLEN
ncbi:aldehyde dehydrogenase family protein [Metabacillus arenae]|uniref:Aldehyde dehydrogenase n=1 Tax=Metabacillus arenae TaxID=2771434 RepID=A0A926NHP6_9BACI|nr:aldehyde dehydrogenase [Metabacillus arenae]MBD1380985.1 aldehyde dehydrogenase [Metabacillus arenae]